MLEAWKERIHEYNEQHPKAKKTIGTVLIVIGFLALITPFTPGSWLIFVGLGILGVRLALWDKISKWFRKHI
ncbi:MAG: hypothetical protein A2722_00945 [Candidatus Doudnabacteria bacterium RIFCSPHIGHO2_01_FULL_50_11]|uniref:TIGR02611 family protein n=1 Tax=Candidatus Doudnabacteria bacterium RIFCSPHIGHO2_01_FULL_50_11 TaxID=1817828 RepID=A0A1F5PFC9_9BACT|nr:MAG: hypothetical protein A2722_00945 [Candidatus Doudnabacteria bacterium RIFCSPHIGHO2_01_FULL_50_11]HLC44712.1 PGPGW domain-containing protein [Patescibacteria group bacterium]